MTPTQLSTLKAVAQADPVAAGYISSADDVALANWFNAPTTFVAWRSVLTPEMAREAIVKGSAQLDALTVGKRDSLFYITNGDLRVSDPAIRAAIDDLCGSQNTLKGYLQEAQKRLATVAEKALATGTGSSASPGTLVFEGLLSYADASLIRS